MKRLLLFALTLGVSLSLFAQTTGTDGNITWTLTGTSLVLSGTGDMKDYKTYTAPWTRSGNNQKIKTVSIEDGITSIGAYAFGSCYQLTSVSIASTVSKIGTAAFTNCTKLESISIPNSVTEMGESALAGCSQLKDVTLSQNIKVISLSMFNKCTALEAITLPNSVQEIAVSAFADCSSLQEITIPTSVKTIGKNAFRGTKALSKVYVGWKDPIVITVDAFDQQAINDNEAQLLGMPCDNIEKYFTAVGWSQFPTIQGNQDYYVTIKSDNDAMGEVSVDRDLSQKIYCGESINISASAAVGHHFVKWSDGETDTSREVLITGALNFTALFEPDKHNITWVDEDGTVLEEDLSDYGTMPTYDGATPTKASTDQYDYTFDGWTPEVVSITDDATYKATYKSTIRSYTITWLDDEDNLIDKTTVEYGQKPSHDIPTKTPTIESEFLFKEWTPALEQVTGDATYKAVFVPVPRTYTITWKDDEGHLIAETPFIYGTMPKYDNPTKEATAQYTYTFVEWTPEVSLVAGDATYIGKFDKTMRQYSVVWKNYDGKELKRVDNIDYGTAIPVYDGETPERPEDAQFIYTFSGTWSPSDKTFVDGEIEFTPKYNVTLQTYTITWLYEDGSVAEEDLDVPYGEWPSYDGTIPDKPETAQYYYIFDGWTPAETMVTGNKTYTMRYLAQIQTYPITWLNHDGTLLGTDIVEYGQMPRYNGETPEKLPTVTKEYFFSGWSPDVTTVEGPITYTAVYIEKTRKYPVIWYNEDGSMFDSTVEEYGTIPTHEPPVKEPNDEYMYLFNGWTPDIVAITGEASYTATFIETERKYFVRWFHEDGTLLQLDMLSAGDMPEYASARPVKDMTEQYVYLFDHWEPEIVAVEQDTAYYAVFSESLRQYAVTFLDDFDRFIEQQSVEYGSAAVAPEPRVIRGKTFKGWDTDFSEVKEDLTIRPLYDSTEVTVRFLDIDGTVLKEQHLIFNRSAYPPAAPEHEGLSFYYWDGNYTHVTQDMDIQAIYRSREAHLSGIFADGQPISGFKPDSTLYVYSLPIGTKDMPMLAYEPQDAHATVTLTEELTTAYHRETRIVVTAENMVDMMTYTVIYDIRQSTNAYLRMIYLDQMELQGFDPERFTYEIAWPAGQALPTTATATKGDQWQGEPQILQTENSSTAVTYKFITTAEDGGSETYIVRVTATPSDDNSLRQIYINGQPLQLIDAQQGYTASSAFNQNTYTYDIYWNIGTPSLPAPVISAVQNDTRAELTVDASHLTSCEGYATIRVKAEDGQIQTYIVRSSILHSNVEELEMIYLDGQPLQGFQGDVLSYDIALDLGVTTFPTITYKRADQWQTVIGPVETFTSATYASYTLTVTSEVGGKRVYTLNFYVSLSDVRTLSMIYLDGQPLSGFVSTQTSYQLELDHDVTSQPQITYLKGDDYQSVSVRQGSFPGEAFLTVTAQDGKTTMYTLTFTRGKSHETRLDMIYVSGKALVGFDPDEDTYTVQLPYNSPMPTLTYDKREAAQTVTQADGQMQQTLTVRAEDGTTVMTYTLNYTYLLSDNTDLLDILVDGQSIDGFEKDKTIYNITLPVGTYDFPYVSWVNGDDTQTVDYRMTFDGYELQVTAGDMTSTRTYYINFIITLSSEAHIDVLYLKDAFFDDFDADEFEYEFEYAAGTDASELLSVQDIDYITRDEDATVSISESADKTITIVCTAPDEKTQLVYVIRQTILKSGNALLQDLQVDGKTIDGFDSLTFVYHVNLYQNEELGKVSVTKADEKATVSVSRGDDEVTVTVTAEDLTTEHYVIYINRLPQLEEKEATANNCLWLHEEGTMQFKAVTLYEGVICSIYDSEGHFISSTPLTPADAHDMNLGTDDKGNPVILTIPADVEGTLVTIPATNKTYIYVFTLNGKVLKSGNCMIQ